MLVVMALDFAGRALALSSGGFSAVADALAVGAPEIWSVLAVETSGCGFLPDRRPPILFERHILHKLTNGRFDDGDISDPTAGGYGPSGAHQYDRLARAIVCDRDAALKSASWGLAQILGENYQAAGFAGVEEMVAAMSGSEDSQLVAFSRFLSSNHLDQALRAHDWTSFARGYNGPGYEKFQYDQKLQTHFAKYSAGPLPDLDVRAAQLYLIFRGYQPGTPDGVMGDHTRSALLKFQQDSGIAATGLADEATLAALAPPPLSVIAGGS